MLFRSVFAIQPEVRYWWGESLIKGHFIGLHVPVTGFNIQLNDKYRYQDPNHALWGVGVSYGYAMPLRKDSKWGVEFTIGVGYMDITYDVYEGVHNGKYLRTETKNYWGLTRLGINFSYRIDMKDKSRLGRTPSFFAVSAMIFSSGSFSTTRKTRFPIFCASSASSMKFWSLWPLQMMRESESMCVASS